jgi:hypothetical protein
MSSERSVEGGGGVSKGSEEASRRAYAMTTSGISESCGGVERVSIDSSRGTAGIDYYDLAVGRGGHLGRAEVRGQPREANEWIIIRARPIQPHFDLPIIRAAGALIGDVYAEALPSSLS